MPDVEKIVREVCDLYVGYDIEWAIRHAIRLYEQALDAIPEPEGLCVIGDGPICPEWKGLCDFVRKRPSTMYCLLEKGHEGPHQLEPPFPGPEEAPDA